MTNSEINLMRTVDQCWILDRFSTDQTQFEVQEIGFDWLESYGIYADFERINQMLPGYANIPYRFLARRSIVIC